MSRKPAKKKAKAKRNSIENRNALATVLTNPMVLVLVVTIGCVVLAAKFWSDYRTTLRDDPRFGIGPDRITMTAQPTWIRSDFRRTALEGFDWHNRSLLDQELVQEVGQHLEQQLWVRKVVRVEKYPTGLNAEIVYRRPVAMVELATKDLYPVDGDGVVLDSREFSPNQADQFLRISIAGMPNQRPKMGLAWPDPRVVDACRLAEMLSQVDVTLGIVGVYGISHKRWADPADPKTQVQDTEFRFWTGQRNEIIWGHAIGSETAGEASAPQKLSALVEVTKRNGPIDQLPDLLRPEANVLDLRSGKLVQLQSKTAAVIPERR